MTGQRIAIITVSVILSLASGCGYPASGDGGPIPQDGGNHLVSTGWLAEYLDHPGLVVIDARPTGNYLESHIPGAVSASFSEEDATSRGYAVSYGCGQDFFLDADNPIPFQDGPPEQIQDAVRDFGIDQDTTVVVYDQGSSFYAGRFFWTLAHHGFETIYILNGGITKWTADGYQTSQEIPMVSRGNFVAAAPDPTQVATTDEVFAGLSDPNVVLVSGLMPSWHYGSYTAYTIPGHIPGTQLVSLGYFFSSDRTWNSKEDLQRMLDVVGVTPDKSIITYCGGGPLSAAMYFAFKYVLEYPHVQNYAGSYLDWIADPRRLPVNMYGNDHWLRDAAWMKWWVGERMQILMPVSPALAVDVRSRADYQSGHIPWSVNVPMDDVDQVISATAGAWAQTLGSSGVDQDIEVVVVDETVTPETTLLFWLLQYLGHDRVSVAAEGLIGWEAAGQALATEDTVIADPITPIDVAIHPTTFTAMLQADLRLRAPDEQTGYPFSRVWVVSAPEVPDDIPVETYRHVPWAQNLTDAGLLESAGALWTLYEDAGVSYFSEIICYSDDPAEATMTYFVLRLLGFPQVAVYLPENTGL